jgi:cytosine/adenosine deaminase-related metal-dependent hydrolase
MRTFSAQYIFTNAGPPLKRGLIFTDEDGTIRSVKDTGGNLEEKESVEFYNGIIVPGFVNCHCHLELSHLKGIIPRGTGLSEFIRLIRSSRESRTEELVSAASASDNSMECEGVILCADICNNASTFSIKTKSRIKYINLLEVFGIDAEAATRRMDEVTQLSQVARSTGLPYSLVPHSLYSLSLPLLRLLRSKTGSNRITSVHFMEASAEALFLAKHEGPIMESYNRSGLGTGNLKTVNNHTEGILEEITSSGNLMLVHNTYVDRETIQHVKNRENLFWCLCPNSNQYIENQLPPLTLLLEENCEIVIGTDSLASNTSLSIIEELKTLQGSFPSVRLEDLICWATLNGARALGEEKTFGTIQPGKKPGLLLLHDTDLHKMELLPGSWVSRLL